MEQTLSNDQLVNEYAANKAEIDRLSARNTVLAQAMLDKAEFRKGSDTGHFSAAGYKVTVTRRINENWDQAKIVLLQEVLGPSFSDIFRTVFEPDRRALRGYFIGSSSEDHKRLLRDACTATPGRPGVKLERIQ